MVSRHIVPKDEMPKSSGIKPAGFEVPFNGELLPGRAQDTTRHFDQTGSGNNQECRNAYFR